MVTVKSWYQDNICVHETRIMQKETEKTATGRGGPDLCRPRTPRASLLVPVVAVSLTLWERCSQSMKQQRRQSQLLLPSSSWRGRLSAALHLEAKKCRPEDITAVRLCNEIVYLADLLRHMPPQRAHLASLCTHIRSLCPPVQAT